MKYLAISILSCYFFVQEAWGHGKKKHFLKIISFPFTTLNLFSGAMYYPNPWWATKHCSPDAWNPPFPWDCGFGELDLGDTGCTAYTGLDEHDFEQVEQNTWCPPSYDCPPGCDKKTGLENWFTNFTFVEERTIDDKFIDSCDGHDCYSHWVTEQLHPWNSPGAAKTFGNGCGANGGNPFPQGCYGEGM